MQHIYHHQNLSLPWSANHLCCNCFVSCIHQLLGIQPCACSAPFPPLVRFDKRAHSLTWVTAGACSTAFVPAVSTRRVGDIINCALAANGMGGRWVKLIPLTPSLFLSHTCCYDEIKGTRDLKSYSHADSQILSHTLSHTPSLTHSRFVLLMPLLSDSHTHSLKTKIYHAHSLIPSLTPSLSLTP